MMFNRSNGEVNAMDTILIRDPSPSGITLNDVGTMIFMGIFIVTAIASAVAGLNLTLSFALMVCALIYNNNAKPGTYLKNQNQVVEHKRKIYEEDPQRYRVLVLIANAASVAVLLPPAIKAAKERGGQVIVLHVVLIPDQLPFSAGRRFVEKIRPLIKDAAEMVRAEGIPVKVSIRIAHRAPQAIIETAIEENVDLLVMEWRGSSHSPFTTIVKNIDQVINKVSCEIFIIQQKNTPPFRNILLPIADPDQTVSALQKVWFLTDAVDSNVELLHVFPCAADASGRKKLISAFKEGIARFRENQGNRAPRIIFKTTEASKPVAAIVKASEEFECVFLSLTRESWLKRKFMRSNIRQITHRIEPLHIDISST